MNNDVDEAPKTEIIQNNSSPLLAKMPATEIKVMYQRSKIIKNLHNIWSILFALFLVGSIVALYNCYSEFGSSCNIMTITPIFFTATMFFIGSRACYKRTIISYYFSVFFSISLLFALPLGTIIGIYGLYGLTKGKELFGSEKVEHLELKTFVSETSGINKQ